MAKDLDSILREFEKVEAMRQKMQQGSKYDDLSDMADDLLAQLVTHQADLIQRYAPPGSVYRTKTQKLFEEFGNGSSHHQQRILSGILMALKTAYKDGCLQTVSELVRADTFSDFLEMATYLIQEKFKDPAAVLIGGVLEGHLRHLAIKIGHPIVDQKGDYKKASTLNDELAKVSAYGKLEQKSVTAWLGLRNMAAHGHYAEYTQTQVELFCQGVREFLLRFPA